ncbi:Autophagy protein 22 [Chytriomyces hyalinus]|nr:Autophagy protein 22 [Chytriomyces hyalinus]
MSDNGTRPSGDTLYDGDLFKHDAVNQLMGLEDIDGSPVAPAEMRSWLFFGSTCSPITGVAFGFFIPLIIQALSAGSGFESTDHSKPCNTTAANFSCVVQMGSLYIDTTSVYFYSVTIAAILQMFLFVALGSLADHGATRKKLMLNFSIVGAVACILFPAITRNDQYWLGLILLIIASVSVGMSWVFVYAYLPLLSRMSPAFLIHAHDKSLTPDQLTDELEVVTNHISGRGFAWGSVADVFLLLVISVLATFFTPPASLPSTYALQVGIAVCGIFWLQGIFVAHRWLRERPGPPLPEGVNLFTFSLKKVGTAISKFRELRNLFLFLLGWAMYSDAFGTLSTVAILLAQSILGFTTIDTLILAFEVFICAFVGIFFFKTLQTYSKLSSKRILQIQSLMYIVIPLWGLLGLIPGSPIGFKAKIEVFVLSGVHGLLIGATQSTCRTLFSQLLPPGCESEFFSLYEITDRGASFIGPLIVAAIDDHTSNKLNAFYFLMVTFSMAFILFSFVDIEKGIQEGRAYGRKDRRLDGR